MEKHLQTHMQEFSECTMIAASANTFVYLEVNFESCIDKDTINTKLP